MYILVFSKTNEQFPVVYDDDMIAFKVAEALTFYVDGYIEVRNRITNELLEVI